MRLFLLALLLISASFSVRAQRVFSALEEPVFSSTDDSLRYVQINLAIRKAMEQKSTFPDSLMEEFRSVRNRIKGYRRLYKSSTGFITLDSLKTISDKSQVKLLSITNLKSRKLPPEVYACTNLQELELVHTRVKSVKQLKRFSSLTGLYFLNNKPDGNLRLSKTKTVRTVVMRGDNSILPRTFAPLVALERLDLAANGITLFPKGLTKNKNLKQLILSNNAITNLVIPDLPALEKLELTRNKVEVIPRSISNLSGLMQLTLNYNSIRSVDPAIASLSKLEQLSFYQNKLTAIPDGLYSLPALREIDLYHNEIERVDERIAQLKNLEILYLSHNKILSLPTALGSLTKLQELYLSDNRLVELPNTLNQLQNLRVMRVNNNRLVQAPVALTNFSQLENLDISGNQISELPIGLDALPALKILVIVNNPWDENSRNQIPPIIRTLRNKEVAVHVEEALEN
jgi:Leucine-rich repeat (LRR) protein